MHRRRHVLAALAAIAATLAAASAGASPTPSELQNRIQGVQHSENSLRGSVRSDTARVHAFQGRLADLETHLAALETSYAIQQRLLTALQDQLRAARARLAELRAQLAVDRHALREQLVADYETPKPDLTTVVLDAHGFKDLLERMDVLRRIARENARIVAAVKSAQVAVARQTARLADLEGRQERAARSVYVERQLVAGLRHDVVVQRQVFAHSRAAKNSRLGALAEHRRELEHQLSESIGAGLVNDGVYGFFQYPGTNYSVGNTPEIARRLNALGKALHLHLLGISGYRTPQHSVEVGGFANDPHTQGEASDTPGVEGVPEATLNQYGLTRPFGGTRELNHIQLVGSI